MIPVPYLTGVRVVPERLAAQSAYPFSLPLFATWTFDSIHR